MKKLVIYEYQAKHIQDVLRLVANTLKSKNKETCLDRDIMQANDMIENVIEENPEKVSKR